MVQKTLAKLAILSKLPPAAARALVPRSAINLVPLCCAVTDLPPIAKLKGTLRRLRARLLLVLERMWVRLVQMESCCQLR